MNTFLFLVLMSPLPAFGGQVTLFYDQPAVTLDGVLDLQTFPGPPNYESIANGDEIERHFYLKLDKPVNTQSAADTPKKERDDPESNVIILQLAISGEDESLWKKFRAAGKGALVRVTGTLFHRFTGHHHSRVLLSVDRLEAAGEKRVSSPRTGHP